MTFSQKPTLCKYFRTVNNKQHTAKDSICLQYICITHKQTASQNHTVRAAIDNVSEHPNSNVWLLARFYSVNAQTVMRSQVRSWRGSEIWNRFDKLKSEYFRGKWTWGASSPARLDRKDKGKSISSKRLFSFYPAYNRFNKHHNMTLKRWGAYRQTETDHNTHHV